MMKEPPDSLGSSPAEARREKIKLDHIKNQMKHIKIAPHLLTALLNTTKRKTKAGIKPIPYVRMIPRRSEITICLIVLPLRYPAPASVHKHRKELK